MKNVNHLHKYLNGGRKSWIALVAVFAVLTGGFLAFTSKTEASFPTSGTLSPSGVVNVTWVGTATGVPPAANGEGDCTNAEGSTCDTFVLTLGGTLADWNGKRARINISWITPAYDYDLYVHTGSVTGPIVGDSAGGPTTFEQTEIDPAALNTLGPFYVHVVYFAAPNLPTPPAFPVPPGDQYRGTASSVAGPTPAPPPPASTCLMPQYSSNKPPTNLLGYDDAGEPSIGVNWNTGNVLFQSYLYTLRAIFDDRTSPATATWKSFQAVNQQQSLDPIMYTDSVTGRTFPNQLLAAGGSSLTAITDNDGESFTPTVTAPITGGADHQTLGGGPFKPGIAGRQPTTAYPNAVYYASQDIAVAQAALSVDGGFSFLPATVMYNLNQCSGLHGHIRVAPDGTVYVPNKNCPGGENGAGQGFAFSEDNGLTWRVRVLPGSGNGDNDPSIGIGAGGRIFFSYTASNKHMRVAVSDDKGLTWKFDQDLGMSTSTPINAAYGITASVFPSAMAGDNDRASVFFHGTDSMAAGDPTGDDAATVFAGTWYPYIATTCNGGESWSVVRADDPVQQGVICTSGTTCPSGTRNLLDFMDITVDRSGRVLGGYADGCTSASCLSAVNGTKADNTKSQTTTILRQTAGSRLFSAFDLTGPAAPASPLADVAVERSLNKIQWSAPYDNMSPITGYKVYRGAQNGGKGETLVATVAPNVRQVIDRASSGRSANYYYRVVAVNAKGESPSERRFTAEGANGE